jgi:hypothetical protein
MSGVWFDDIAALDMYRFHHLNTVHSEYFDHQPSVEDVLSFSLPGTLQNVSCDDEVLAASYDDWTPPAICLGPN